MALMHLLEPSSLPQKRVRGYSRITYDNMIKVDKLFRFPEYSTDYLRGFNGIEDFTTANSFGPRITGGLKHLIMLEIFSEMEHPKHTIYLLR